MKPQKRFIATQGMRERYGVCDKTLDRWVTNGVLPVPTRIRGRKYWREDELEAVERNLAGRETHPA